MENITNRILEEARCIIETKQTIREIARKYNVSKSTVHKDLGERLKKINKSMSKQVNEILEYHIKIRHIRGGISTKKKYEKLKNNKTNRINMV